VLLLLLCADLPEEEKMKVLKEEVAKVPPSSYGLMKRLFGLFEKVALMEKVNKMNAENISVVFHAALRLSHEIVIFLIIHYSHIFDH
jgi:hypothetical protein